MKLFRSIVKKTQNKNKLFLNTNTKQLTSITKDIV